MLRMRTRLAPILLTSALAACGSPATPTAAPPQATPPAATATPTAAVEAPPPQPAPSYVMQGTLLGHDGKPMKLAHLHIGEQSTPIEANGSFKITAPGPGFLPVRFTGVDHAELSVALYFDGHPADVEITLGTYERRPPPFAQASVAVYVRPEGGGAPAAKHFPEPVKKLANGQYGLVLLEKSDEVFYALDDVARGHRVNGVEGDGFVWDGRGTYLTQMHRKNGAFRILLDAAKMPPPGLRPHLRFADPKGRAARITSLRFDAALRAEEGGARATRDPSWRAEIARALEGERDPEVAAALRLAYLTPPIGLDSHHDEAATLARDLLDRLPADAPLWGFTPSAPITAVDVAGRTPEREAYLDRIIDGLRDRETAATFVGARIRAASRDARDAEAARLFAIMRERFAGTNAAHGVSFYDPARHVRPDHEAPAFDLPALPDGTRTPAGTRVSRASLRGKVVLIDFWGFWCAPCVAEMGNLHDAFERYRDAGFTIVSVAVRTKPPAIRQFRTTRWPMPWLHVLLDEKTQEDVIDQFEIKSYPSPILIDRTGKIIAAGDDLRGDNLDRAVAAAVRSAAP
ncbi:MAG: TlpA disulfide reductase family protein [Minicystis sp.]